MTERHGQRKLKERTLHKQLPAIQPKPFIILTVTVILVFVLPWPIFKILAFFAVVIALTLFDSISRPLGVVLLALLFALAYLFSPYWLYVTTINDSPVLQTVGPEAAMVITLFGLLFIGALWAYLSAGDISPQESQSRTSSLIRRIIPLAALALLVLISNYTPLKNNISVLGDESYHITRIRLLHRFLSWFSGAAKTITPASIGIAAAVALSLWWKRFRTATILGFVFVAVLAFYIAVIAYYKPDIVGRMDMLRYPFISGWFDNLGPIWGGNPNDERMFRIIPLISTYGIACFGWWATRKHNVPAAAAFLTALAFALTPTIYYYSTILYLELPAVALLMIALYFIESILTEDFKSARNSPGWYALLAVGFIKETLIAFIAGTIVLRILVRAKIIIKNKTLNLRTVLDETAAAFCIGTPLAVYLFLLFAFGQSSGRSYYLSFNNLTNVTLYSAAFKALWSQFGLMLPLAIAGLVINIIQRRFLLAFSMIFLFSLHFFFHFLEVADYVGLARYNLFLFPTLAVPAIVLLGWMAKRNRPATIAAAVLFLLVNVALSPVAITGDKNPTWSAPLNKSTTEYYFPLEDTVKWLKANRSQKSVLIGGAYGYSNILWYFDKLGYHPPFVQTTIDPDTPPAEALRNTIENAHKLGVTLLVWHKMQGGPTLTEQEKSVLDYIPIQVFSNRYLALVIYEYQPPLTRSNNLHN